MARKEYKELSFVPCLMHDIINDRVKRINDALSRLQRYVKSHDEDWFDVLHYLECGALYKINQRKEECNAWLDKSGAPDYIREDAIAKAIADLGEDNLAYWRGLIPLLRIMTGNVVDSEVYDIRKYTDVSDDAWRVSQAWIDEQTAKCIVNVPEVMAHDREDLQNIANGIINLYQRGYDLNRFLTDIQHVDEVPEVNVESFYNCYNSEFDRVHPEMAEKM